MPYSIQYCAAVALLLASLIAPEALAQETTRPTTYKVEVVANQNKRFQGEIDIGSLQLGSTQEIALEVTNTSPGDSIDLKELSSSCGCVTVSATANAIPPLGTETLKIRLSVLPTIKAVQWVHYVSLGNKKDPRAIINVVMRGQVAGILATKQDRLVHYFNVEKPLDSDGDTSKRFQIPLELSHPVELANLTVITDDPLAELLKLDFIAVEENPYLEISIDPHALQERELVTAIHVKDRVTGQTCLIEIIIGWKRPLQVLPHRLRLFPSGEEDFVAYAMLHRRIDSHNKDAAVAEQAAPQDNTPDRPVVQARLHDLAFETIVNQAGPDLLKVELRTTKKALEKLKESQGEQFSSLPIRFSVIWKKETYQVECRMLE